MKNNNIYLLNKLSQKENKALRNAYEKEMKYVRDDIEKGNKALRNKYEKKIKSLRDKQEKKITSLNDEHREEKIKSLNDSYEQEIQYLNDSYEQEIQYLNDSYEQQIKSTDKYNQWITNLFHWDIQSILAPTSILILLYLSTIFLTKNSPLIMFYIFSSLYLSVAFLFSITISLDKKISLFLYLKARIIYFFSYFHSRH